MTIYKVITLIMIMTITGACDNTPKDAAKALRDAAKSAPGLQYMMMKRHQVIIEANYGFADIAQQRPVRSATLFSANSVTKTLTAVAILKLVAEGRLKLNDSVSRYLDNIHFEREMTVEHLLSHTSGLKNPIPLKWIHLQNESAQFDAHNFFDSVLKDNHAQSWQPGTDFRYSNLNYLLLGRIVEKISGVRYEQFVNNSILSLVSSDLSFSVNDYGDYAYGYQKRYTLMSALLGFLLNEKKFIEKKENGWLKFKPFYNNGAAYGGLIGNARSFNIYLQELMRGDSSMIDPELMIAMTTPHPATMGKMSLSWFTGVLDGQRYFCHAGGGGGYYCEIRFYPDLKISSAVMLNRTGMRDERLLDKIDRSLIRVSEIVSP